MRLIAALRSLVNTQLRSPKPRFIARLLQLTVKCLPFKQFAWHANVVEREKARLLTLRDQDPGMEITIVIDKSITSPGLGDLVVNFHLLEFLVETGLNARIQLNNFSSREVTRLTEAFELLFPRVFAIKRNLLSVGISSGGDLRLFEREIKLGLDTSRYSIPLMSALYSHWLGRGKADLRPYRWFGLREKQTGPALIGFGVRHSSGDEFRNPPDILTLRDLKALSTAFPGCTIRWFGEKDHYLRFQEDHRTELARHSIRLEFQRSQEYFEALLEAKLMDFWFQRWGGGISVAPLFSNIPYKIISNDVPGSKISGFTGRRQPPWRLPGQSLDVRTITSDWPVRPESLRQIYSRSSRQS